MTRTDEKNSQPKPLPRKGLRFLYRTLPGRAVLKLAVQPPLSNLAGAFLNGEFSCRLIPTFIEKNGIDLEEVAGDEFRSFNAFFTRRLLPGSRPVEEEPLALVSPCDGWLSAFPVEEDSRFSVKGSCYSLCELLHSETLAEKFRGGSVYIFRLTPADYHHYIFFDSGKRGKHCFIPGVFHTVDPVVHGSASVYHTNSREVTLLHTEHFSLAVQVEVGALLVGKICNLPDITAFRRGDEKGYFEFGGSTVMLIFQKDTVKPDEELFRLSREGQERKVRLGEKVGVHF